MEKPSQPFRVEDHFAGKPAAVRKLYDRLLAVLKKIGPIAEDPKKTSIHLVRSSALAGVEVRSSYLLVNIKADQALQSPRIQKSEQISARRFHHKVKLASLEDIDGELSGWLQMAYDLSA